MMADAKALVRAMLDAMNRRELGELDALLTDDFTRYCEATPEPVMRGLDAYKAFLRADAVAFPDNVQTLVHCLADGDEVAMYVTYEGTHHGPLGPMPATGKPVRFDFAGVGTVRDGKLADLRLTWDNMTILRQLGALPDGF